MARIFGVVAPCACTLIDSMAAASQAGYVAAAKIVRLESAPGALVAVLDRRPERFAADADGVTIVMDGAVYNRGEFDKAANDARLVADLYRKHGFEGLLGRLNADCAIALHDRATNTLWLARDRLGVKPLYFAQAGDAFAFASRPGPLLNIPGIGKSINRRFAAVFAASHYRYFDNVPHESPYERVAQLPAAHWLRLRNGEVTTACYLRLEEREGFTEPENLLAERYRELLLSAVGLRLTSSERAAFTLSGGMDSSSVLASARHLSSAPQHAFSTVYSDKTFDESEEIRPMLQHAVSQWHAVQVDRPDLYGLVRRMIGVNDEPIATATWLSHFLLCEVAARAGFDALFGGLGGDELNAGEYEYFFFHFADLMCAGRTQELET